MAKLSSGILGLVSGRIGPVVDSTWKNVSYIKGMAKKRRRKGFLARHRLQMKTGLNLYSNC